MKIPYVIAEVGNCHEGSLEIALELIERAKDSGADFVKFQAGRAEGFARQPQDIARYRKYELGLDGYWSLVERAFKIGIEPIFSVWNVEFEELLKYPVMWRKIPARQCIRAVLDAFGGHKTFISIPHSYNENDVRALGMERGFPLHCVTEYPAKDAMLSRIAEIREWTGLPCGFSDHTIGIESATDAALLHGAMVIEKHFTKAHDFGPLRDHALAATPEELKELVRRIRGKS